MKTRQDHIDFDRNYCEHYSPQPGSLAKDYCALGLGASERMDAGREAGEKNIVFTVWASNPAETFAFSTSFSLC